MKQLIFAIRDSKVGAFMQPWFAPNKEVACRLFGDLVRESGHQVNLHPEDYSLYYIGLWDPKEGSVQGDVDCPELVMPALAAQEG